MKNHWKTIANIQTTTNNYSTKNTTKDIQQTICKQHRHISNDTNNITVTEVKMSQDLKVAKAFVLPLGGKNAEETITILKEFSFLIRKTLSKKITMKFLPKILFAKDESFEYAEKIENLIKQTNKQIG